MSTPVNKMNRIFLFHLSIIFSSLINIHFKRAAALHSETVFNHNVFIHLQSYGLSYLRCKDNHLFQSAALPPILTLFIF